MSKQLEERRIKLKQEMAGIGFELPWFAIDSDIEFFLNSTKEQKALIGVKASLPDDKGTGFLCVTQDYIMFARCSLFSIFSADKGNLWAFERPTTQVTTSGGSLSIHYNQNGESGFVNLIVDPPRLSTAFVTFCRTGRRPIDPLPPRPAF